MAKDPRRAQKAAQKRRPREQLIRREKSLRKSRVQGQGSGRLLSSARDLPVVECIISQGWRERGLAHILLARDLGDGHFVVGGYFLDTLCLGLKDTAALPRVEREEYESNVKPNIFNDTVEFEAVKPGFARGLVEGAMKYAEGLGFRPSRRWAESRKVWSGIEAQPVDVEFGRGGHPCLILRDGENLRGAIARLERTLKPGMYEIVDQRRLEEGVG